MAIYHLEAQAISRSQGRSSVAASAYRACEKILDERTGIVHDFTRRKDLIYQEILTPENAPDWMKDRAKLWNHVEHIEKRKDSQLARELNISLPRELTDEQKIALAKEFIQNTFVDNGMVADMCIHDGHKSSQDNPHIHVMLGFREVAATGFGQKNRSWNDVDLLKSWRASWADYCNRHLAMHGHDMRIDHRSYEEQGINLEPQTKIGAKAATHHVARSAMHKQIARENGERLLHDPEIALEAITRQQSTFIIDDIARFVNRHTDSREQFNQVFEKIKSSEQLVHLGIDKLGKDRYSTLKVFEMETNMCNQAEQCSKRNNHSVSDAIQKEATKNYTLNKSQQEAYSHMLNGGDTACVVGFAGTGKSYLLGAAKEAWNEAGYNIKGMSLTKKVADNLQMDSGIESHTIANRLINWENDRERITSKDVVVIDEAGMVSSRQMARIVEEVHNANAKLVLVGDWQQLQAIEAGAPFRAIADKIGYGELKEILRQRDDWQKDATKNLAEGNIKEALQAYDNYDLVHEYKTKRDAINSMLEEWQETRSNLPDKSQLLLAYTRSDVRELNKQARSIRKDNQELGDEKVISTNAGNKIFAEEDRIMFLRNEKSLNISNGTLGTIKSMEDKKLTVELDNKETLTFSTDFYNDINYGYASTIHKNQGTTVDKSYVLASKYFDQHATYVALSRHRDSTELYWSHDEFYNKQQMYDVFSRERAKDNSIDYTKHQAPDFIKPYEEVSQQSLYEAQQRLEQRQFDKDLQELSEKLGKEIHRELYDGDCGAYRGKVTLGKDSYGLLAHSDSYTLLDYSICKNLDLSMNEEYKATLNKNKELTIEAVKPEPVKQVEQEQTRAITRERTIERSIDFEMSL